MLFNSHFFLFFFLPLTLLAWWIPKRLTVRLSSLVVASYVFYGWWDPRFCLLMFAVTCTDYLASRQITRSLSPAARKRWLLATLIVNLGILGYFKYAGFFLSSINESASALGIESSVPVLKVILPLGISFYIFESLSYTIDIYRGIAKPAKSFLHYMLFIAIFPKLIAGPIIRYTDVEAQYLSIPSKMDTDKMWRGILFFVTGMAKKVLIADSIATFASIPATGDLGLSESWLAIIAFTLQIYFDFSGYSDMAVGIGLMLGFQFPQNFDRPYLAGNISEFWNRWHITLGRWLRDYLFIPLGGSRNGIANTLRNLIIVMLLGGLWHGASFTFVLWGLYNGLLLALYQVWRSIRGDRPWLVLPVWPARLVTLFTVMFGWALFMSPDLASAGRLFSGAFGFNGMGEIAALQHFWETPAFIAGAVWIAFLPEVWTWQLAPRRRHSLAAAGMLVFCIGALGGYSPFIYYQF